MNEARMLKPAVIGGVLLGVLSALPFINYFNCICCAWVIIGGVLAAHLYVKESPVHVTLGRGITLGLLTGVIGTGVYALVSLPLRLMMNRAGVNVVEQMRQTLDRIPNLPPETRQMIENLAAQGNINILIFIFGLLFMLVIDCIFGMIGGAIGVALFEKRAAGAAPPDVPPYQPPADQPPPDLPPPPPPPTDAV